MEPIDDLEGLRPVLRSLADRNLVVFLSPEGKRGTTVTHGFHHPAELKRLRASEGVLSASQEESAPAPARHSVSDEKLQSLEAQLAEARTETRELRTQLTALQSELAELRRQFQSLKEALGA
jgi:septal ring factor EnvC (AmiA/AmiB activator)